MDKEEWRDIEKYPGYKVSNLGRLMSFKRYKNGRILKQCNWS